MPTKITLQCKFRNSLSFLVKMWPLLLPSESEWFRSLIGGMSPLLDFNGIIIKASNHPLCFRIPQPKWVQSSIVVHRGVWWGERSLRVVGMEVSMPCLVHMTRQGGIDSTEIYMGSTPPSGLDVKRYDTSDYQKSGVVSLWYSDLDDEDTCCLENVVKNARKTVRIPTQSVSGLKMCNNEVHLPLCTEFTHHCENCIFRVANQPGMPEKLWTFL